MLGRAIRREALHFWRAGGKIFWRAQRKALQSEKVVLNEALRWFGTHHRPRSESLFKAKAGSASAGLEGGSASLAKGDLTEALPAGKKDFPTAEKEGSASAGGNQEALRLVQWARSASRWEPIPDEALYF